MLTLLTLFSLSLTPVKARTISDCLVFTRLFGPSAPLAKGEEVSILSTRLRDGKYQAQHQVTGVHFWLPEECLDVESVSSDLEKLRAAEDEQDREQEQARREQEKARRERLLQRYDAETVEAVLQHKIRVGWTRELVRESWGEPVRTMTIVLDMSAEGFRWAWQYRFVRVEFDSAGKVVLIRSR
jgi:hypothetical protein